MPITGRWLRRLRVLVRSQAVEHAMDDEMRYHIECEVAERMRAGQSQEDARIGALQDFGGVERFKEEARDARGVRSFEDVLADSRYSSAPQAQPRVRDRRHSHAGLGIGATGAIFSVVYGVLLRPLPYEDPARLVVVWERNIARNTARNVVSVANFEAWRDRNQVFEEMAALVPRPVTLVDGQAADRVNGAEVSAGYFDLLGIAPVLGRGFDRADATSASSVAAQLRILAAPFRRRSGRRRPNAPVFGKPYTVSG